MCSPKDCLDLVALYTLEGSARGAWREFQRQKGRQLGYDCVLSVIRALPQAVRDRVARGEKYFHDRHVPYIPRDYSRLKPNDRWVFDHTQLDFFVNAWGAERPARPWLTAIMDMSARYIVGWCLSLQPDSLTIGSALRMALLNCGVPRRVYLDNGKDFRARYLSSNGRKPRLPRWRTNDYELIEEMGGAEFPEEARAGIFDRLGVEVRYCMVYHPQSKPIERFFRTLHEQFDRPGFNSYCGRNPASRPPGLEPLLREHQETVRAGRPEQSPLPMIEETALLLESYLGEYHAHRHSALHGRSPAQVYTKSGRQLAPGDADVLLLKSEQRQVERGAVRLFSRRYEPEDWRLCRHNGHTAKVAYDPHRSACGDMGDVLVYCCGESFRCLCQGEPKDREELRRRLAGRREFIRAIERGIPELQARASVSGSGERRRRELAASLPPGLDPRTPVVAAERLLPASSEEKPRFPDERGAAVIALDEVETP